MVKDEHSPYQGHCAWFTQRSAYPLRDAHPERLEPFWALRRERKAGEHGIDWKCAGPLNIAGRVTALIAHPSDPKKLYAGAAAGGVWRSADGGRHWENCWPEWINPHIGALAFDPRNPATIYCGTGEANVSPDAYPGSGVAVTRDGGDHWDLIADAGNESLPRRIGAICPDPHKPGRIYIGGINLEETQFAGLYWSEDGGKTWHRENFFSLNSYWCHDIVPHPDGSLYAALYLGGAQTGVWRKDAAGWKRLGKGMPGGDHMSRISLAPAPSNPDVIYALVGARAGKLVLGVYRSRDRGESWENISGNEFVNENQSRYNNTIAVHPSNPDVVVCGVTDVHVSRDGGGHWVRASQWDADPAAPVYAHADQHALVLPGGDLVYAAGDGGVFASEDLGQSWTPRMGGMSTVMFYNIDVSPVNGRVMCGGTQDNGTLLSGLGHQPGEWTRVLFGDGAWTAFHPREATHVYGSTSAIRIHRHTAGEHWAPETWLDKTPKDLTPAEHAQVAIAVMVIDHEHPSTLWFGSRRLWRTTDDAQTWQPASPVFDGSAITAIEIPPAAPDQVWVGTMSGGIFRSLDRGANWSGDLSGPEVPARYISRIETHPRSAARLVVTVAGTGVVSRMVPIHTERSAYGVAAAKEDSLKHVFYSEDAGITWRPIESGDMPDVAYHAAVFETHEPHRLFVANDCGVWMTSDLEKWTDVSAGLPNSIVNDLVYHHKDRALIAATYGRGAWRAVVR